MREWKVSVWRTVVQEQTVLIDADTREEAKQLAVEHAIAHDNHDFWENASAGRPAATRAVPWPEDPA